MLLRLLRTILPHAAPCSWFKFQNSWGADWGCDGYFYTAIEYLADPHLACDFWFFND